MWVKLSDEGMVQLGLAPVPSAYALAYSKDRKQEFLEEKEVSVGREISRSNSRSNNTSLTFLYVATTFIKASLPFLFVSHCVTFSLPTH